MSTYCISCGAEIVEEARFCPACGAPRVEIAPASGVQMGAASGAYGAAQTQTSDPFAGTPAFDLGAYGDGRTVNLGGGSSWRPYDEPTTRVADGSSYGAVSSRGYGSQQASYGSQGGTAPDSYGSYGYGTQITPGTSTASASSAAGYATTSASAGLGPALLKGIVTRLFLYSAALRLIQLMVYGRGSLSVVGIVYLLLTLAPAALCFFQPKGFEKWLALFPAIGIAISVVQFINANGGIVLYPEVLLRTELPYVLEGVFYFTYYRACTSTAANSASNKRLFLIMAVVMGLLELYWTLNYLSWWSGAGMAITQLLCLRGMAILLLAGQIVSGLVLVDQAR